MILNKLKRPLAYLSIAAMLIAGGCSDSNEPFNTNSSIEATDDSRISYFDIDPMLMILESTGNIQYANLKSGFFNFTTHKVEFSHNSSGYRCGIFLHESKHLDDGEYLLTFSNYEHEPIEGMMKVIVKDEKVVEIGEAKSSFSLRQGSGTKEDPYIIGSARDFLTLLDDLRDNELTNGRGSYFKQTADISLMDQSSSKPGRGYFGYSFAGTYDGGGFALKDMYYRGGEDPTSDTNIGIFPTLLDGACVSNLTISGANISNAYSDVGLLAGTTVGTVKLSTINVHSNITCSNATNVGGLIGRVTDGTIDVSGVAMYANIVGKNNVGGIIGKIDDCQLANIFSFLTPDHHFSIEGYDCTGGAIGAIEGGKVKMRDILLSHTVSKEDADIRIIQNTGGSYTGGVIGKISGEETAVDMKNITVACPVGGLNRTGDRIGGIIGSISSNGTFSISEGRVTSIVSGAKEVGGYIGHCTITGANPLKISGSTKENYIIPDNSAAGIEAETSAGGVFGYYEGQKLDASSSALRVAVNVDASSSQAGGVIGKANNAVVDLDVFDMTSSTMQVSGESSVGGMIGIAVNSTFTGKTAFNYAIREGKAVIPDEDDFTPVYTGVVKGSNNVGGILGKGENVTLKALASKCTVTGTNGNNFGGIAGYIATSKESRLEDLVSMSLVSAATDNNVGGICGFVDCKDYTYVTDCINYGEVAGAKNTGGIFGTFKKFGEVYYNNDKSTTSVIRWSVNMKEVSGSTCVGGIAGRCDVSTSEDLGFPLLIHIDKCGNNGKITSASSLDKASGVGGIVGYGDAWIEIEHCTNNGYILSTDAHKAVGGIAGSLGLDAATFRNNIFNVELHNSHNNGTIDSQHSSTRVGGVLGFMEEGPNSNLKNCLNTGKVLHKHNSDNGGILGYVDHLGNIFNCVNIGNVEEGNATIGTHKTGSVFDHDGLYLLSGSGWTWPSGIVIKQEDLCNKAKYSKLDFNNIWDMSDAGPILRDCPF